MMRFKVEVKFEAEGLGAAGLVDKLHISNGNIP